MPSKKQQLILDVLRAHGVMTTTEVAKTTGVGRKYALESLRRLEAQNLVRRAGMRDVVRPSDGAVIPAFLWELISNGEIDTSPADSRLSGAHLQSIIASMGRGGFTQQLLRAALNR